MKILVTGAGGFVGRAVVCALSGLGHEVHGTFRRRTEPSPACAVHVIDLSAVDRVHELVKQVQPETILHLAWFVDHGKFWRAPQNLDCVAMSLSLARAAVESGCCRFIGVGTCYEYDFGLGNECIERATPTAPTTLYATAKDATRRCLDAFFKSTGTQFAWARLFYLYGPYEAPGRLVPSIAMRLAAGEVAPLSAGRAVCDFMDVRDAGAALAALSTSPAIGAFNIASGVGVSVADIARHLGRISGRANLLRLGDLPDREGEPRKIVANVERLKCEVGYRDTRPIEQGLTEAYDWWRKRNGV